MSVNKKGAWKSPETIPYSINSKGSETSFTFSPTGNEIYFVTDSRKDNIGGKDIYFIKRLSDRKWSSHQNVGSKINTILDEESVRLTRTGDTLFFSSKGHNSIGGFDVFYSVKIRPGSGIVCGIMDTRSNTPWDELFYYPAPDVDSTFYFVSNRSGGTGGMDIYRGRLLPPEPIVVIVPPVEPKRDTIVIRIL